MSRHLDPIVLDLVMAWHGMAWLIKNTDFN